MDKPTVLIVEDEAIIAHDLSIRLEKLGYEVIASVPTGTDAIEKAGEYQPDIVLMDIMLKGEMDGIEAARIIRKRYRIPVIYVTAFTNTRTFRLIKRLYPYSYLTKPFEDIELKAVIE
jgi:CheY-like chemotaxis protein